MKLFFMVMAAIQFILSIVEMFHSNYANANALAASSLAACAMVRLEFLEDDINLLRGK